jgi:hypothetical protein
MASSFQSRSRAFHNFRRRLFRSRYFTISLFVHLVLIFLVGSTVLFKKFVEPPDFTGEAGGGFVSNAESVPTPQSQATVQSPTFAVTQIPVATAPSLAAITSTTAVQISFALPPTIAPITSMTARSFARNNVPAAPTFAGGMSKEIASGIADFSAGWAKGGQSGLGSSTKNREFQFTAFLARYSGGDWNSTVRERDGKMIGSLPNLLYVIGKLSRDKIHAEAEPVPLDLSSDEIFSKRPPFIFFTGHRDFNLTEREVENLQKYLRLGGCIWGDSSLPGQRSRFDIAFRREMRRVIPDIDKNFEPLPPNHDIFNPAKTYYPDIREVPAGVNYYKEPVYALKIYGEIAILYTANDYGDMWQFGLNERLEFDTRRDEHRKYVAMNETMLRLADKYFRNINAPAVAATYKFGTNIVVHLLTRWEDKVRNVPKGL